MSVETNCLRSQNIECISEKLRKNFDNGNFILISKFEQNLDQIRSCESRGNKNLHFAV